ncbi:MAG: hypothetical protein A2Y25_11965 [Candidatus Melainabacteria bacterium GWF2_37_15]|nr:MAG: hypothetical protein A2Y25_11965 [Candidatus Melainabacteria bacterium GWF2_37_15]
MPRELTEKQKKFCECYVETNSVKKSGEKAGYAKSTIKGSLYRYLKKPLIIEYIKILKVNKIYSIEQLVKDLNTAMEVAVEAKKPDQIIKIIEFRMKLSGLEELIKPENKTIVEDKPEKDFFKEIEELTNELERKGYTD